MEMYIKDEKAQVMMEEEDDFDRQELY